MPIQLECDACGRRVKVEEEYAGRKIRCPGCEEPIRVPKDTDDFDVEFEEEDFEERPAARLRGQRSSQKKKPASKKGDSEKGWFRRNWHWVAVGVMLLFSLWPKVGLVIAGLISAVGVVMILIGGIAPFLRVIFGAPGTVISMLLSTRARFDMMRAPDNHPYKVLVRTAFDPTRGLFWKGVLLMVMFIPVAIINSNIGDLFKSRGADPAPNPNLVGPGQRPAGVPPQGNPNFGGGQNNAQPGNPNFGRPGVPAQGGNDRVFVYTVTYQSYTGQGPAEEAARTALGNHPGFIEESLKVDEETKTMTFELKGGMAVPALSSLLRSRGFPSVSVNMSSK